MIGAIGKTLPMEEIERISQSFNFMFCDQDNYLSLL